MFDYVLSMIIDKILSSSMKPRILAHRGVWNSEFGIQNLEKNSISAITRAQEYGFGLETDIRNSGSEIVICHDAFTSSSLTIEEVVKLKFNGVVAYNVKSDGLSEKLSILKIDHDHFYFDCSIPETLIYRDKALQVASRLSEIEPLLTTLEGFVWVDSFYSEWWNSEKFYNLLSENKNTKFIFVSPELHGRDFLSNIEPYLALLRNFSNTYICSDFPLTIVNMLS